jgi:acetyl-CoA acetyltransferase
MHEHWALYYGISPLGSTIRRTERYDLVWLGIQEPPIGVGMGLAAENLAAQYEISRQELDYFAVSSHQRAARTI